MVTHQAALRAYVVSLMPGQSEVDDVIQEANSWIWQKRVEFEPGTNFRAWMFSVAKFKVLAHWRDRQRRREWVVPEETLSRLIEQVETGAFSTTSRKQIVLRECLLQLRPNDRGLILKRYLKGGQLKELATEVGRSTESLKVSLHRIRTVLRKCVESKMRLKEVVS